MLKKLLSHLRRKQVCIYCVSKEKLTLHISVYHGKTDYCKCTAGNLGSMANGWMAKYFKVLCLYSSFQLFPTVLELLLWWNSTIHPYVFTSPPKKEPQHQQSSVWYLGILWQLQPQCVRLSAGWGCVLKKHSHHAEWRVPVHQSCGHSKVWHII